MYDDWKKLFCLDFVRLAGCGFDKWICGSFLRLSQNSPEFSVAQGTEWLWCHMMNVALLAFCPAAPAGSLAHQILAGAFRIIFTELERGMSW